MKPADIAETVGRPLGRVVALQFANIAKQAGGYPTMPVLRVHVRPPNPNGLFSHNIPNQNWSVGNAALQFMALHGFKPSDLDGTFENVEVEQIIVDISPSEDGASWRLAQSAFTGGERALREAEWFSGASVSDEQENSSQGGGNDDDDDDGSPTVEKAPEDSDAGFNIVVE